MRLKKDLRDSENKCKALMVQLDHSESRSEELLIERTNLQKDVQEMHNLNLKLNSQSDE